MLKRSLVLLLLLGAGCSQSMLYGKDNMPLAQARATMAKEGGMGHLDGQFVPLPGQARSTPARDGFVLDMTSSKDGRICVMTETEGAYHDEMDGKDAQHLRENSDHILGWWQQMEMVFEARQSFDDWTEDTSWPSDAKATTDDATIHELRHRYVEHMNGASDGPGYRVDYQITWCGPVKGLDASSRFITVTRLPKVSQNFGPILFVWAVDGAASAAVTPPTAPPMSASPSGAGIVATLSQMGRFSVLLRIIDKAGIADDLDQAPNGYTMFALTDSAFDSSATKKAEELTKNATTARKFILNLVLSGAVDAQTLKNASEPFKTLGAQKVRPEVKGGVIYVSGEQHIVQADVAVSHGLVHVTD